MVKKTRLTKIDKAVKKAGKAWDDAEKAYDEITHHFHFDSDKERDAMVKIANDQRKAKWFDWFTLEKKRLENMNKIMKKKTGSIYFDTENWKPTY